MKTRPCSKCGEPILVGGFCPNDGARAEPPLFGPGYQLDKYIAEEQIGEGGMGEVWLGRHAVVGKKVAIKLLSPEFINNKEIMLRFRREAQAVNEIRSKHLIDIFDFGELPDGRPYFVMEHLEGKPLSARIEQGPLPFAEVFPIFEQLCRALQAAHDRGIVHRDLKPDNIFLLTEENGQPFVKVLDFGIAKLSDTEEKKESITRTGAVFGTPAYMSPEQCEGTKKVDHRSDIYSMGIILCEMLCGRTPFAEPGESTGVIMAKHIMTQAKPLSELVKNRKIPASVDALVLRALSKDPNARPAKVSDFYSEFAIAAAGLQSETSLEAQPIKLPNATIVSAHDTSGYFAGAHTKQPPKPGPSKSLMAGAALSLLFGSVLAYAVISRPEEPIPTPGATPAIVAPAPEIVTPKTIKLSVNTSAPATVLLDGAFLGQTPLAIDIPYGEQEVTLRIQSEGFEIKELKFTPKESYNTSVELKEMPKTETIDATAATTPKKTSAPKAKPKKAGLLFEE